MRNVLAVQISNNGDYFSVLIEPEADDDELRRAIELLQSLLTSAAG